MKKLLVFLLLTACLTGGRLTAQSVRLKTLGDSVSYALGVDMARSFERMPFEYDSKMVIAGLKDALETDKAGLTPEEAQELLRDYMTNRFPAINKLKSEKYLEEIQRNNPAVRKTDSGLLYEILTPGSDERAVNDTDTVVAHYEGRLMSGKVFDSSRERNEAITFSLGHVIAGWTEGIKLVGKGGMIRLWIPPDLGYGENGMRAFPPNEALYFEVEVIDINP